MLVALSLGALLMAGGLAVGSLWGFTAAWNGGGALAGGSGTAAGLGAGGLLLVGLGFAAVWALLTLGLSAWGAWRLARGRAIGQSRPGRELELR